MFTKFAERIGADEMVLKAAIITTLCAAGIIGLSACTNTSSAPQVAYIATDGDVIVGTGNQVKQGEYIEAACDFTTGKLNISSTHITDGVPVKLNPKYAVCDSASKKLIMTVNLPQKGN